MPRLSGWSLICASYGNHRPIDRIFEYRPEMVRPISIAWSNDLNVICRFFGESCAVIALCLAVIGAFHKTLDRHGSALIRPNLVHLMRAIVALIFALLPLTGSLDTSLKMLAIYAGIWAALVVFETTASLGSEPAREDELHPSYVDLLCL